MQLLRKKHHLGLLFKLSYQQNFGVKKPIITIAIILFSLSFLLQDTDHFQLKPFHNPIFEILAFGFSQTT